MSMFPVVKHLDPKASDGVGMFQKGQQYASQGYFKDGQTLIQEALQLFTSVYGNIHPDVINSQRLLARLDYIQGNHTEAIEKQHKVQNSLLPCTLTQKLYLFLSTAHNKSFQFY